MAGDNNAEFLAADKALTGGSQLLVCSVYEDQRPLKGVAAALDWRLLGSLSRFVLHGRITGQRDEFVYVPVPRHRQVCNLLLVGLGPRPTAAEATSPDSLQADELMTKIARRVQQLGCRRITISRSSFPFFDEIKLKQALTGFELELTE